jgi:ribonuclease VapC
VIAVDTSAIIAIALREPDWEDSFAVLDREPDIVMSAVTMAEILIVSGRREVVSDMPAFLAALRPIVIPADAATARRISDIYTRWGKGQHPAALNFCDCFAYDVARQFDCPLLFVGNDFAQTDIRPTLGL